MENIINQLNIVTSREEANNLINNLKKSELTKIAKELKVYCRATDKKDMVIKKIVEHTIGFRLRNEAIKSIDLGYGDEEE